MLAIAVLLGWIATVCLHEFGHALVAYYGGDTTVKEKGYLTLNPLKYTDIGYSLVMPVVFLVIGGLALPGAAVYINTTLLRSRAWKSAVSAAGPFATAVVGLVLALPFKLGWANADLWYWNALALLITLQVAGFFFNLLPVPSFDGFGILAPWLPETVQRTAQRWGRYGYLVLLALFWTVPAFSQGFWSLVSAVSQGFLSVPGAMMRTGYLEFMASSKVLFIAVLGIVVVYRQLSKPHQKKKAKDLETALAAYDQAIQFNQADAQIWFERGQTLCGLGQFEDAIASFDSALQSPCPKAEVWYSRAVALHQTKHYQAALADYEATINLDPAHSYAWANKARILQHFENSNAAVMAYDRSLKSRSNSAICWQERGLILRGLGQTQAALLSFGNALKYERSDAALWINYAELLSRANRLDQALKSYSHALRLDPENIAVWRAQGTLYLQLGLTQKALRSFSAALSYSPHDLSMLLLRGLTLYSLNQIPPAQKDFELIQSLIQEDLEQPEQSNALLKLSPTLKPALTGFTPFLDDTSDSPAIAIAQGMLLTVLKRPHEALSIYCQALNRQPQSTELNYLKQWTQEQI